MFPDSILDSSVDRNPNRRTSHRYPISLGLTYRMSNGELSGTGRTLDIGSHSLSCSGLKPMPAGTVLEVSLDWPILLEDCPLKLVMFGRVLRSNIQRTAILITRYEFRTRKRDVDIAGGHSTQTLVA